MEYNILCQKEEQIAITDFFEEVSKVLKECDDCKEKETIKEILRSMNETVSYIVLGEEAVGKTTLLKVLFQNILDIQGEMQGDICEFRYGEQAYITPSANGYQKRFVPSENLKGISIIDTKGLNRLIKSSLERVNDLTSRCQAIFVVLDAGRINSPVLWDMIEDFSHKNMIFVLTKCDLLSGEEVSVNVEKLKSYMKEADIAAPIFPVSLSDEIKMLNDNNDKLNYEIKKISNECNELLDKNKQLQSQVEEYLKIYSGEPGNNTYTARALGIVLGGYEINVKYENYLMLMEYLDKALSIEPNYEEALLLKGVIYKMNKDTQNLLALKDEYVKQGLDPDKIFNKLFND